MTPTAGASKHSRLERLPIDAMKIDKSFLEDAGAGENGVETAKQWEFLKREGCDYAQGYLLGRPTSAAALSEMLLRPQS